MNPYDEQEATSVVRQNEAQSRSRIVEQDHLDTERIRVDLYELCKDSDNNTAISLTSCSKHRLYFDEFLASQIIVIACAMLVPIQTVVTGKCKVGKSTIVQVGRLLGRQYSVSSLLFSKEQLLDTYRSVFNEHKFYLSSTRNYCQIGVHF